MVPVNIWAVIVSGIAMFVLGFLWYGPVFGKTWMKLAKITDEQMKKAQAEGQAKMIPSYAMVLVGALVMSYVFAVHGTFAMAYFKTSGAWFGIQGAFWTWLGFIAPVTLSGPLWEGKSWKLYAFDNAYRLISLAVAGAIIASWVM